MACAQEVTAVSSARVGLDCEESDDGEVVVLSLSLSMMGRAPSKAHNKII